MIMRIANRTDVRGNHLNPFANAAAAVARLLFASDRALLRIAYPFNPLNAEVRMRYRWLTFICFPCHRSHCAAPILLYGYTISISLIYNLIKLYGARADFGNRVDGTRFAVRRIHYRGGFRVTNYYCTRTIGCTRRRRVAKFRHF